MNRFAPLFVLVPVTGLFLGYGNSSWSWLAGPVAALALWSLDRKARRPIQPAPVRPVHRHREPAAVD